VGPEDVALGLLADMSGLRKERSNHLVDVSIDIFRWNVAVFFE